jgi:hypothetical protein
MFLGVVDADMIANLSVLRGDRQIGQRHPDRRATEFNWSSGHSDRLVSEQAMKAGCAWTKAGLRA